MAIQSTIKSYSGKIKVLGTNQLAPEGVHYNYIRLEDEDGNELHLPNVTLSNRLHSYLSAGNQATLFVCEYIINSNSDLDMNTANILYAVRTENKTITAIDGALSIIKGVNKTYWFPKLQAVGFIILGIPTILLLGLGFLLIGVGIWLLIKYNKSIFTLPDRDSMERILHNGNAS